MLKHKYQYAAEKKAKRAKPIAFSKLSEPEKKYYQYLQNKLSRAHYALRKSPPNSPKRREIKRKIKIIRRDMRVILQMEKPIIPPHPSQPDFEWLVNALLAAYFEARKNKRHTVDEQKFEVNYLQNIIDLADDIYHRRYKVGRSIAFVVHRPVDREIFAAEFRDRIVHHFLVMMIGKWWDNRFITNSFSCRKEKGTHYGQRALLHAMRSQFAETGNGIVVKLDIKGFFMHINKKLLYSRVRWGLDQEFGPKDWLCRLCKYLAQKIIFDNPQNHCVIKGAPSDWKRIPMDKILFCQPDDRGLPIGNLSSQLFANIYLDMFDRYMVYGLGYKHYGRYVDDFYFVIPESDKQKFLQDLEEYIAPFLTGMGLTLHPKKRYIQDVKHAVVFVGQYISIDFQQPSARIRRNFNQFFEAFIKDDYNEQGLKSYIGTLKKYPKFLDRTFSYYGQKYNM